jgi:hypothetical protein
MGEINIGASVPQVALGQQQAAPAAAQAKANKENSQNKIDTAASKVPRELVGTGTGLNIEA